MNPDELSTLGEITGLLCLSIPSSRQAREPSTQYLEALQIPALISQGARDEFRNASEVTQYELSDRIEILWLEGGDHDLKLRKTVWGLRHQII